MLFIFDFIVLKIVTISVLSSYCDFSGGVIACLIIGSILEFIGAVALGDSDVGFVREFVFYIPGMLLQFIPILVLSVGWLSVSEYGLNFMKAIAIGWAGINQLVLFFQNGESGMVGFSATYGVTIGALIVNWILSNFISLHSLLVLNFIVGVIAILIAGIARIALGSNMD